MKPPEKCQPSGKYSRTNINGHARHPPVTFAFYVSNPVRGRRSTTPRRRPSGSCLFLRPGSSITTGLIPAVVSPLRQIGAAPINLNVKRARQHRVKHLISHDKPARGADSVRKRAAVTAETSQPCEASRRDVGRGGCVRTISHADITNAIVFCVRGVGLQIDFFIIQLVQ